MNTITNKQPRLTYVFCYTFLIIMLVACTKTDTNFFESFNKVYDTKHTKIKLNGNNIYYHVFRLYYMDGYIIALDIDETNNLSITDIKKRRILARFCKRGQGPNELLGYPLCPTFKTKGKVQYFVANNNSYFDVDISSPDKPVVSASNYKFNNRTMFAIALTNDYSLAMGLYDKGMYALVDKKGEIISNHFEYPSFEDNANFTNKHKAMAFQGDLLKQPNGDRICFSTQNSEVIDILNFNNEKKALTKVFSLRGKLGKFVPEGDGIHQTSAAVKRESTLTFINACCTNKYIYLLYSGHTVGEQLTRIEGKTVFVIDWDGKSIARYNLDVNVTCITVSDNDKTLYAIAEQGDTNLVQFDLK